MPAENFLILFLLIIIYEAANTCLHVSRLNSIGLFTRLSLHPKSGVLILGGIPIVTLSSKIHLIRRIRDHSPQFPSRQDNRLQGDYQGIIPEASNGQASTIRCHGNACVRRSRLVTVVSPNPKTEFPCFRVCHHL